MKRIFLRLFGKFVLAVSPFLWRLPFKWAFNLHQKLGAVAIRLHHTHKLNLWDEQI